MQDNVFPSEFHLVELSDFPQDINLEELTDQELLSILKKCDYEQNVVCYQRCDSFFLEEIENEYLLISMDEQKGSVTLDRAGAFLWEKLKQRRTAADLIYLLRDEFGTDPELSASDMRLMLEHACEYGIIQTC